MSPLLQSVISAFARAGLVNFKKALVVVTLGGRHMPEPHDDLPSVYLAFYFHRYLFGVFVSLARPS
jgi:hypothetical protein